MRARLLGSYVSLVALVLLLLAVPLGITTARAERIRLRDEVRHDALAISLISEEHLERGAPANLARVVTDYRRRTGARVVIVDKHGVADADGEPTPGESTNFANRPEIAAALRGREAYGTRYSATLHADLIYVAEPVASEGVVYGAVRITYPTTLLQRRITRTWMALAASGLVVLGLATLAGLLLARSFDRPLRDLGAAAERVGAGDLSARAPVPARLPEIRAVAEVFNDTVAKLDVLVRAQRAFVADASHQLRSPLAALRLRLENLAYEVGPDAEADVAGASQEVRRLSALVDALLALAHSDEPGHEHADVDVRAVVADRAGVWEPYCDEHGVHLVVSSDDAVHVLAMPGALDQVLDNLLANALDASPDGGTVTLAARAVDGRVEVSVADEGPGLSETERARAFDRFWRSARSRAGSGGSGLGLAIVQRLVTADGGDVRLEPVAPQGLRAVVTYQRRARSSRTERGATVTEAPTS